MKKYIYIIIGIAIAAACVKQPSESSGISVDMEQIPVPGEGGSFALSLTSDGSWTSSCDVPWITVSPANGPSAAQCRVNVDSTVANESRSGLVRFYNRALGTHCDVKVTQDGYGYNITLDESEVSLKHTALMEEREFTVKVRTNVPFSVRIPETARKWLSCSEPEFNFDRGARPRDVEITFKWGVNSIPLGRDAQVEFVPQSGYSVLRSDLLSVKQAAAPEIVIGHDGDSIAVQSLGRSLSLYTPLSTAEPMRDWDNVKLWEPTDEGYTEDKKGRVRAARFTLFAIEEEIPYEVQYLTEAEELYFFSNANSYLRNLSIGEHICKLTNLKKLTVSAYGLSQFPEEFANLKNLEYLDISCNNFSSVPSILTPENFPNLKHLYLNTCQRYYILDLSNSVYRDLAGLKGEFPRRLLEWEKLETLRLSVNFIEGEMPDMLDYPVVYTESDCTERNLPPAMIGKPKVLPNATFFAFNLNRMYGDLPEWVLIHPNLTDWEPYSLCYPQEGRASNGRAAVFNNVPVNMDYYWSFYDGYKEHEDIYIGD